MLVNNDLQDRWIPRYFRLAIANMLSNLMVPLSGMVSVSFLGHLQDIRHLAGVALATVVFNYFYRALNFLRLSVTGTTAQATGRNDQQEVLLLGLRNVLIALGLGFVVLLLQYPLRELGFIVLNNTPDVKAAAVDYFNTRIWGVPAVLVNMVLFGWLMGREQSQKVLVLSVFGNVVNIILSYQMILRAGLDSMGAGLAQALSQFLMMVLGLIWVKSEIQWQEILAVAPQLWDKSAWNETFALSKDLFIRTLAIGFTFWAFTNLFAGMGRIAFAENVLLIEFMTLGIQILNGLSYATETLTGNFHGTNEQGQMVPLLGVSIGVSLMFAVIMSLTCILFPQTVFGLLTNHTEITTQIDPYIPWLMSVLGLYAFAVSIEAYFFGLAEGLILRNAAFIATGLGFIPTAALAWKLQSVHLLWLAMSLFIVTRIAVQGIQIPRTLKLAVEDIPPAEKTQCE
ncbi:MULTISPECIES: guanitoxin biosynthesis MATE family efflux transporter GntT [unclassified Nostoc]|uniref:guanitoxin biosynthesis MATE family efflux transporter GntT n=1 Tax=unclassified Nostoc TaxID=2593658 RepID=UPI002618723A|nr:guanitoxin biosynthesis MATE family efflux transporter GntT [Nostoc sp. S13]MDF5737493.1 guanitoxin biosynthesis MATE family efflux transporter GntT [Nostoc sp. S13]